MTPATPRRALVVDDAPEIVALIEPLLRMEGFEVASATDGAMGLELARELEPELVVLDLTMPKIDGLEVCRRLRSFSDAYVLMLTGRSDEGDLVSGLTVGADDYMTKPFSARELVARVRAMQRRPRDATAPPPERRCGDITIDVVGRAVHRGDDEILLTKIEFDLLSALSAEPGVALSRAALIGHVWGPDWFGDDHLVDVHVGNLRQKLGDDASSPRYVRTVRGIGYRLVAD